jgi:hypothetical protein
VYCSEYVKMLILGSQIKWSKNFFCSAFETSAQARLIEISFTNSGQIDLSINILQFNIYDLSLYFLIFWESVMVGGIPVKPA